MPELLALGSLLAAEPEWTQDASGVSSLTLKTLCNIAAAYKKVGDPISAAIVLEAGLRQQEEIAGIKSSAVKTATKQADKLLDEMKTEDREIVIAHRTKSAEVLNKVSEALTEELGAYKQGMEGSKVDEWNELGARVIGPMRLA